MNLSGDIFDSTMLDYEAFCGTPWDNLTDLGDDKDVRTGLTPQLNMSKKEHEELKAVLEQIQAIYKDYDRIIHDQVCDCRSLQSLDQVKLQQDPEQYFYYLASCAHRSKETQFQGTLTNVIPLGTSVAALAAILRSWYHPIVVLAGMTSPHSQGPTPICDRNYKRSRENDNDFVEPELKAPKAVSPLNSSVNDRHTPESVTEGPAVSPTRLDTSLSPKPHGLLRRKHVRRKLSSTQGTKGVYNTPHGFRVQLNMRPVLESQAALQRSAKGNVKFSRNCRRYEDALWLYECILLISDRPRSLEDILCRGNYQALSCNGLLGNDANPSLYHKHLGEQLSSLRDNGILLNDEWKEALDAYERLHTGRLLLSGTIHPENDGQLSKVTEVTIGSNSNAFPSVNTQNII